MNTNMSKRGMRIFYIILIPIVLLIILMNSGILQNALTAVTIDGQRYTAVEYNYFFYSMENDFMEENYDSLNTLGFDPNVSSKNQLTGDGISWWEYFCSQAERRMSEIHYLNLLAEKEGHVFSEEELVPVERTLQLAREQAQAGNVSFENYIAAYYGTGISQEKLKELLTLEAKADAYLSRLRDGYSASPGQIQDWIAENDPGEPYHTANLSMIALQAGTDRETGAVTEETLAALGHRVQELEDRFASSQNTFEELTLMFCEDEELRQSKGMREDTRKEDLPEEAARWCFDAERKPGDVCAFVDEESAWAYLILYHGRGIPSDEKTARDALAGEQAEGQMEESIAQYEKKRSMLGMRLVGR